MRPNRRPKKRETWTIYEGDSTTVAKEFLYNAQNPGGTPSETKNYAYDPSGNLIALSDSQGSTTNRYTTVENPQSSVSLLLNQSGSPVQSYGYSAYGQANSTLTQNGSLSANLNPYRFQSKRLDGGFNTYDMGARRYSLTTSRWQQQDQYYDADQNLGLSQGATTADRYEFAGGNPVTYVEADGHEPWCQTATKCAVVGVWKRLLELDRSIAKAVGPRKPHAKRLKQEDRTIISQNVLRLASSAYHLKVVAQWEKRDPAGLYKAPCAGFVCTFGEWITSPSSWKQMSGAGTACIVDGYGTANATSWLDWVPGMAVPNSFSSFSTGCYGGIALYYRYGWIGTPGTAPGSTTGIEPAPR